MSLLSQVMSGLILGTIIIFSLVFLNEYLRRRTGINVIVSMFDYASRLSRWIKSSRKSAVSAESGLTR